MAHRKMLHLYLHHRHTGGNVYENRWGSDSESNPESIQTYAAVVKHCQAAMESGTPIRIHRRKYKQSQAVICCECKVKSIDPEGDRFRVYFHEYQGLNIPREKLLRQGWYLADPSIYETSQHRETNAINHGPCPTCKAEKGKQCTGLNGPPLCCAARITVYQSRGRRP